MARDRRGRPAACFAGLMPADPIARTYFIVAIADVIRAGNEFHSEITQ
jgi:hypothetical protein